ncbi:Sphingosine kinase 2, partial [Chytridiales sp. JEL 0842]
METIREREDLLEFTCIACCGGDGVFHELVNGLLTRPDWEKATKIPLTVIPAGKENTFAKTHSLHHPLLAALTILHGTPSQTNVVALTTSSGLRIFSHAKVSCRLHSVLAPLDRNAGWLTRRRKVCPYRLSYIPPTNTTTTNTDEATLKADSPKEGKKKHPNPHNSKSRRAVVGPPLKHLFLETILPSNWDSMPIAIPRFHISPSSKQGLLTVSFPSSKNPTNVILSESSSPSSKPLTTPALHLSPPDLTPTQRAHFHREALKKSFAGSSCKTNEEEYLKIDGEDADPAPFSAEILQDALVVLEPSIHLLRYLHLDAESIEMQDRHKKLLELGRKGGGMWMRFLSLERDVGKEKEGRSLDWSGVGYVLLFAGVGCLL